MRVVRDFDEIYEKEQDPWAIGKADGDRYNFYYDLIVKNSRQRGTILDIGCGFGALLSRFKDNFKNLNGVEISAKAIEKGRSQYPFINYEQGSADRLSSLPDQDKRYDAIIYSDVICYLTEGGKNSSLQWISSHLEEGGLAFIAAWAPGKRYLARDEFRRLVRRYFIVEDEHFLPTGHAVFLCRKKKILAAVTLDYETWHPIPEEKTIDWEKDVFEPADKMLTLAKEAGIPLTFMVEMGEYFWLTQNEPSIARKMEEQWKRMVAEGHDVQLHLHPNWLPELGAAFQGGQWSWDWSKAKAADYPGVLTALISKCKKTLEDFLKPVKPGYQVTCFRAGAYQAQPFDRLSEALTANGIFCDSSVYRGGVSEERGYDYSWAASNHQPYWAHFFDPQFQAPPGQNQVMEIPIFTFSPRERWFLDGGEGRLLQKRIQDYRAKLSLYSKSSETYRWMKRFLPQALFNQLFSGEREKEAENEYFVMIGHTKGEHDFDTIGKNLKNLVSQGYQFKTLSGMSDIALKDLSFVYPWRVERKKRLQRALEIMEQVYQKLNPEKSSESEDPEVILQKGYAWCWGYVLVLGHLLKKEGFKVRWVTMLAKGHPRGRGKDKVDSHEVLEVDLDGRKMILDSMANSLIPHSLQEVLARPALAGPKKDPDERYRSRGYDLYDTEFWYSRVFKFAVRKNPKDRIWFWSKNRPQAG